MKRQKWSEHVVLVTVSLGNVLRATAACTFFDISTSKGGPRPLVFYTLNLEMRFAPQWRTLFRHLNVKKRSEPGIFLHFWLGNVLRATAACTSSTSQLPKVVLFTFCLGNVLRDTTACTFSTSQLPKVVRAWCAFDILTWKCALRHNGGHFFNISTSKSGPNHVFLYILTWKCASRHSGVQFFISHLTTWLRTRRFSEPTFRPSGAANHWKNRVNRDFAIPFCAPASSFFSLFLFSDLLISFFLVSDTSDLCFFHVSILSEVWLLKFLRIYIYIYIYVLICS